MDLYNVRKDLRDAIYAIEAIAQIGGFEEKIVKNIAAKMLGDPYYLPREDEFLILAAKNGVKTRDLAEYLNKSPSAINRQIRLKSEKYIAYPLLSVEEDEKIIKFLERLELFKKAGL